MNSMQQVNTWNLLDIIPITADPQTDVTEPSNIQIASGPTGWSWDQRQGGTILSAQAAAYGDITGQFRELAQLWSTYRLDSVHVQFVPNMTGAGGQSATISAVDPAGEEQPYGQSANALLAVSRLRSVKLTKPYSTCNLHMDYRSWLIQCCPQPFLQTVDPGNTAERVFYPTVDNTAPVLRMGFQTTTGVTSSTLGFFRINAKMTVRGRRGVPLAPELRLSKDEQLELYARLRRIFEPHYLDKVAEEKALVRSGRSGARL